MDKNLTACEMESECQLSAVESSVVSSILEDLERQIDLIRSAALKAELGERKVFPPLDGGTEVVKSFKSGREGSDVISNGNGDGGGVTALEAKLEYSNLEEEFAKLKIVGAGAKCDSEGIRHGHDPLLNFSRNADYILDVIRNTRRSLQETNFLVLKQEVDRMTQELGEEAQLPSDIVHVRKRIMQLKQDISSVEEEASYEEQQKVAEINRLKDQHFFIHKEGKETLKVAKMYFEAKETISKCDHRDETSSKKKLISEANRKVDRDVHCLAMMEAWTDDFCEKLEAEIDKWKLKLRKDEMLMDMRIDAKRRDILAQEELMKSLNETIAQRQEELAPWEEEKEQERQARLAHMRRYYSARKLQRWWRG